MAQWQHKISLKSFHNFWRCFINRRTNTSPPTMAEVIILHQGMESSQGCTIIEPCSIIRINYNTTSLSTPLKFSHRFCSWTQSGSFNFFLIALRRFALSFKSLERCQEKARNSLERPLGGVVVYRQWQIWKTSVLWCWARSLRGVLHCFCSSAGCCNTHPKT